MLGKLASQCIIRFFLVIHANYPFANQMKNRESWISENGKTGLGRIGPCPTSPNRTASNTSAGFAGQPAPTRPAPLRVESFFWFKKSTRITHKQKNFYPHPPRKNPRVTRLTRG